MDDFGLTVTLLNLAMDDAKFCQIFLQMIATLATSQN
jgi:hypothetical protein